MARKVERPQVALIGRPNVGKSTLFNRLTGTRLAITDEMPGVTRDRLFGVCEWDGYELGVIDCGGIGPESEDPLWQPVADNAREAMKAADLILMITDVRTGMTLSDDALLKELRRLDTPVVVAVNKVDDAVHEVDAYQFYSLGYSDVIFISALSGRCVGELLDLVVTKLDWSRWDLATPAHAAERYGDVEQQTAKKHKKAEASVEVEAEDLPEDYPFAWSEGDRPRFIPDESWRDDPVQLVFVGRQNVGKSSLTNALLGEERVLVNELAGTTRDPIWAEFTRGEQRYEVLDTAGMKRISRLKEDVDYYSLIRAEHGLRTSEVALLVLDAADGVMEQDKRVAAKIAEFVRAVVIVVNKADLLPEGQPERRAYEDFVRDGLGKLPWAEVVFTSATEQKGLKGMLAAAVRSRENFHRRIDNNSLKMVLEEAVTLSPPPIVKNRELRFYDFRQIGNCPPTFLIEVNEKRIMRQAYRRYLYNSIRKHFDFSGTHIEMVYYIKRRRKRGR
jgi:GTP-binding protein